MDNKAIILWYYVDSKKRPIAFYYRIDDIDAISKMESIENGKRFLDWSDNGEVNKIKETHLLKYHLNRFLK